MTTTKTIKITVWRGIVTDVTNLPPGWSYRIDDRDSAQLGGDAEDFCPRCGLWHNCWRRQPMTTEPASDAASG